MCFIVLSALQQADFTIRETIPKLDLKAFYTAGYDLNPLHLAKELCAYKCRCLSRATGVLHRVHRVFLEALVALAKANEKTHPLASLVWCQSTECASRGLGSVVRPGSECWAFRRREKGWRYAHRYLLAIFLLIQGQTNIQTRAAQISDSAKVMRKMDHTGSISNPSTANNEHTHTYKKIRH